jgi:hypothetical protein
MQPLYTIVTPGGKDGPHDLVSIMRKIRSGKVTSDTLLFLNQETTPVAASSVAEIKIFFETSSVTQDSKRKTQLRRSQVVSRGWQFVSQHTYATAYAGLLVVICVSMLMIFSQFLPPVIAYGSVWVTFVVLHNIYLLWLLSEYRGQQYASQFLSRYLLPNLAALIFSSLLLAMMISGGLIALIIPGILVAVIYVFVPFLMADRRYRVVEAMLASRLLIQKAGKKNMMTIVGLVGVHFICLLLVIPIPLTLPLFAAMLSDIYEELITA